MRTREVARFGDASMMSGRDDYQGWPLLALSRARAEKLARSLRMPSLFLNTGRHSSHSICATTCHHTQLIAASPGAKIFPMRELFGAKEWPFPARPRLQLPTLFTSG
jgi:hypothetical protein